MSPNNSDYGVIMTKKMLRELYKETEKMDPEEIELWLSFDVRVTGRLSDIMGQAGSADMKLTPWSFAEQIIQSLLDKYQMIDFSKYDDRFPINDAKEFYQKAGELKKFIGDYKGIEEILNELVDIGHRMHTERYEVYRRNLTLLGRENERDEEWLNFNYG